MLSGYALQERFRLRIARSHKLQSVFGLLILFLIYVQIKKNKCEDIHEYSETSKNDIFDFVLGDCKDQILTWGYFQFADAVDTAFVYPCDHLIVKWLAH